METTAAYVYRVHGIDKNYNRKRN